MKTYMAEPALARRHGGDLVVPLRRDERFSFSSVSPETELNAADPKSIHAGKAKIDVNVDFTHKLCASLMLPTLRSSGNPLSLVIGSLCIKHPNLFGGSEKLDVSWDKGLYDSNILVAYRRPRPEWLAQQSFVLQHSLSPEIGVHGIPINNFSRSGSGGVNLSRLSLGLDLKEPVSPKWSSTTSIKFEVVKDSSIPVLKMLN
ncbi:putative outer envelope protein 80, chloroplastic-like [Sesbania bispinosa]|nr:putative outer envelope protein 80, chloroplastic-like [Sesbania bispinosa]